MSDISGAARDHAQRALDAATIRATIETASYRHRAALSEKQDQVVGDGVVTGFVELDDVGEALVDLHFPYTFTQEPIFTYGYILGPSSWPEQNRFPSNNATVVQWFMRGRHYIGAKVAIKVTGSSGQEGKLSYRFEARSFANPVGGVTRMTSPI